MTVIMSEEAPYRDGEIHDGILSVANMVGANFGGILTFPKEIAANQTTSYICELVKLLRVGEERVIRCYLRDLLQMERYSVHSFILLTN